MPKVNAGKHGAAFIWRIVEPEIENEKICNICLV